MAVAGIDEKILVQVCIIVRDLERTMARYIDIFGFPVPEVQTTMLHDHTHATYFGQPTDARAKLVCFEIGRLQFELLQPLGPPSSWMDFLVKHGEGIHHIAFFVPKADAVEASLAEHGYVITQKGLFTGQTGTYTYLDTDKDLAVVLELLEHFGGSPKLDAPPFPPDLGIGTDKVIQVGMIVHNIERTVQHYVEVLGVPTPPILITLGYDVSKTTYNGAPTEAIAKLAFLSFGQIQIELIEPDEKPSVWRQFLDEHGEGAQHIAFRVQNTKQATDYFATHGISVAQQGLYSDGSGIYTYMNSQDTLGTTVELLENFPR